MAQKRNMVIHFMDGTKIAYDFPKQVEDQLVTSRMTKLLENQYIVIEADGAMYFYPVNNIKSIQVYPIPNKLPDYVISDAESAETF